MGKSTILDLRGRIGVGARSRSLITWRLLKSTTAMSKPRKTGWRLKKNSRPWSPRGTKRSRPQNGKQLEKETPQILATSPRCAGSARLFAPQAPCFFSGVWLAPARPAFQRGARGIRALWRERSRRESGGSEMMRGATVSQHDVAAGSRGGEQTNLAV